MSWDIHGVSLCRRGPKLTHLLFADDSLLFCRSNLEECAKVLEFLNTYEGALGQKVNKSKTVLFFRKSTIAGVRAQIKEALGVPEIMHYEKYIGLPSFVGRGKKANFKLFRHTV